MEAVYQPSMPLLGYHPEQGDLPPLLPLLLSMEGCATQSEMNENVTATLQRGYVRINEYLDKFQGEVALCGSGPSLADYYKELKGDVFAINNAHVFLLEHGVVPKFSMFWDAAEVVEQFAVPHPDVTYLVGARCHPKVFERLKGCKVICWHAGGDHNIHDFMVEHRIDEPMINGGSAGVTRAMYLVVALGYRALNLYGADSSYSDSGKTHVNHSVVPEKDFRVWVGNGEGNKGFRTTPEWCAQVEEYKMIFPNFVDGIGIKLEAYGDGMLPHMHRLLVGIRKARLQLLEEQRNVATAGV